MKDAQKPDHVSLITLVGRLREGRFVIPDFQLRLGGLIETVLNRTPLTADTSRAVIKSRLPSEYLPQLIAENGETVVRATLELHLTSPAAFDILVRDPFTNDGGSRELPEGRAQPLMGRPARGMSARRPVHVAAGLTASRR